MKIKLDALHGNAVKYHHTAAIPQRINWRIKMKTFATIAEFIASAPVAVWVDTDGQSGFTYTSEDAIAEHGEISAAGGSHSPSGTESFRIEARLNSLELIDALIDAGIQYEAN
jgi:hypothetical protein